MSNKNFNNNDNESFMEGIYGCLERIETAVIELQKFQPNEGNSTVPNVDNTALVQEIKALVENATGANCKYTERKIQELTKTLSENLGVVNDNVKGVSGKNKPDFVAIQNEFENLKKLTASLIPMIEESKVLHRENDYNFNLNFNSKLDWFMLTLNTIVIAFLASAYYFESQRNKDEEDFYVFTFYNFFYFSCILINNNNIMIFFWHMFNKCFSDFIGSQNNDFHKK